MHDFKFEYIICDGELMDIDTAIDEYGITGSQEHCSDIVLTIVVHNARTAKEAKQKMIEYMKIILKKEMQS